MGIIIYIYIKLLVIKMMGNDMSRLDILILVIGIFYFTVWCTRILSLILRSFFGT